MGDCDDLKRPSVDNGDICPLKRPKVEPVKQEKDNNPFCPESQNPEHIVVNSDLELHTGAKIPQVQFGTYKMKKEECYKGVLSALRLGYRGLDTASVYDNEKEVGQAIKDSGIPRTNLFVQTKLWRSFTGNGKNGKPKCDSELGKSLRKLGTDYVDLWLMHWPGPGRHLNYPPVRAGMDRPKKIIEGNEMKFVPETWTPQLRLETYKQMCKNVSGTGRVRALGVCNFSARQLKELLLFCNENELPRPALVQNECHPYLVAKEVRRFCADEGIIFQAYASLGAGAIKLLEDQTILKVAKLHEVTPAQVLLRWGVQHGCALLPKSVNSLRQQTNLQLFSFKLSAEEMDELDTLDQGEDGQNTMVGWLREHDPDFY